MVKVAINKAKRDFTKLIDRALQGEDIIITHNGQHLVRLVPIQQTKTLRPMGLHRKKLSKKELEASLEPLRAHFRKVDRVSL
jgi:prevent-host-death family protein